MTLDTRIYITDPIDHKAVFDHMNRLIKAPVDVKWSDEEDGQYNPGRWTISNDPFQGLDAWLMVYYRPNAPLVTKEDSLKCDEDCEPDFPNWLTVSIDTAYSGRSIQGEGCGDLHSRLVTELGSWLDAQGVDWHWRNEFTGEVFHSYDGLDELGDGGKNATRWFNSEVLPAIIRELDL